MAREDAKKSKSKKRTADVLEEAQVSKIPCLRENGAAVVELEEDSSWKNLQLVLSLRDKNKDIIQKVELAFAYVKSYSTKEISDLSCRSQVLNTSTTLVFLNNWVQLLFISSEKKMRLDGSEPEFGTAGSCLDLRCWEILHFCLDESKKLHIPLTCFRDLLRVICCIAVDASSLVSNLSLCGDEKLYREQVELYDVVLGCILLTFSFHGGVANENLDLWISVMDKVLGLVSNFNQLDGSQLESFVLQLACSLLDPFSKFLRVHPTRKNGFRDFIDKLLEPLLHLICLLHSRSCGGNADLIEKLVRVAEEVVAQGLFHPTHIDGFLTSHISDRYKSSSDATVQEEKMVNKSYHRHLFDKVEKIVAEKKGTSIVGLAHMFHLFVNSVTKHKGHTISTHVSQGKTGVSQKNQGLLNISSELRKPIFDLFIQITEYLLTDVNKYLCSDIETSLNVSSTLKSIRSLLGILISDKVYLRTEDTSDGAYQNFLRTIYDTVMSFSTRTTQLQISSVFPDEGFRDVMTSLRKELIVIVHHLLDIEYEVVGNDLESLWAMVFSSVVCSSSFTDLIDEPLLFHEVLSLGCKLIDLYSELRQVESTVYALCRAVRRSSLIHEDSESDTPSHSSSSYSMSLGKFCCSLEFRLSLGNAIRVMPEGQAAGFLKLLNSDIIESLEWINIIHQTDSGSESREGKSRNGDIATQAELLGMVLSEVYTIILDKITISNGDLFSGSLKKLVEMVYCGLVSLVPGGIEECPTVLTGIKLNKRIQFENSSACWIHVFFFRLLLSSRCLFREVIILMSSDGLKKMFASIGDISATLSGKKHQDISDCAEEGFFPWTLYPPAPPLSALSNINIQNLVSTCPPLNYLLHAVAIQRLVDLNQYIESSKLKLKFNKIPGWTKLNDDVDFSSHKKITKKLKKHVSEMMEEAAGLTKLILGFLPSVDKHKICRSSFSYRVDETAIESLHKYDTPNFPVCLLDEKMSSLALWWIICKNIGLWSSYAEKKDLKKSLTLQIEASVSCEYCHFDNVGTCNTDNPSTIKGATAHQLALYLLSNTITCGAVQECVASRFCRTLQKSVSAMFTTCRVDLNESPDWVKVMSAFDSLPVVQVSPLTWKEPSMAPVDLRSKQTTMEFVRCQCLLALLTRMPIEHLSSRSSSLYITSILNLERVLVGSMLGWYDVSGSCTSLEVVQLLVLCRRVLDIFTEGFSKTKLDGFSLTAKFSECSFPLLWLLKSSSAVINFQLSVPEDIKQKNAMFSLINHTSNVLLALSKYHFKGAIASRRKVHKNVKHLDPGYEDPHLSELAISLNSQEHSDGWGSVSQLVKILEENMASSTTSKDKHLYEKVESVGGFHEMNKLSNIFAFFKGLLSGIASALGDPNAVNGKQRKKLPIYGNVIYPCVATCTKFLTFFLRAFFLNDDSILDISVCASNEGDASPAREMVKVPSCGKESDLKRRGNRAIPDLEAFLAKIENVKQCLKKSALLEVVRGENAESALFLQQVFSSYSTILRLNLLTEIESISWDFFPIVVGVSEFLLSEFSSFVGMPQQFDFYWLNGVMEFVEAFGSYLPLLDPLSSKTFYIKLVYLHIRAIGKCICLQGKESALASQETSSHAKILTTQVGTCFSPGTSRLGGLKAKLRTSVRKYFEQSSELHLQSAVQAVESALVGVHEGLASKYDIIHGSYGGDASAVVAASIDCLDLILEFVKDHKRLNMIKEHTQSLVACLFNIILHLQAPGIFHLVDSIKCCEGPDPGSVILMCIATLANIYGKHSFFHIDACHISQSLRVPGAVFQYFLQLQLSESPVKAASGISITGVDWKFSVELYAESCRLLCTTLKHHKNKTRQCLALLQDSITVLLHCLEFVNVAQVAGRSFSRWEVQEAVTCAGSLRRVYEEIREQKDVFGGSTFQLLSSYIWVYCGFGPSKCGIIREVDEVLKPGIYALIETCSADDLQLLHTVFGEGPCRSTLAALQHDYKLKGKYDGKV